ncbi:MAG: BMP family ABC transporter substrate-binding protein [Bacilli bacterium]|nr:BMP family ABC transporter substrate-binding protein [Bacilli bacterium]
MAEVAPKHPDVKFIGLDISPDDFPSGFSLTDNIAVYNYHEEIAGYLAGYGVVKEGFRRLGFLGGIPSSPVIRFGYGYVQGADAAAKELEENIDVQYVYGGQFFGDSDIFKYIDNWYKVNKTEIVFSCGGSIYTSVALSAKENNGYLVGVDSDQSFVIDRDYGEGICITSAMKGIKQTVIAKLDELYYEHIWQNGISFLGLVSSEHPELNYVQLPTETWRMKNFTIEDYKVLVGDIMSGKKTILDDTQEVPPVSEFTKVSYRGSIK